MSYQYWSETKKWKLLDEFDTYLNRKLVPDFEVIYVKLQDLNDVQDRFFLGSRDSILVGIMMGCTSLIYQALMTWYHKEL